jgi:hypothetical protein
MANPQHSTITRPINFGVKELRLKRLELLAKRDHKIAHGLKILRAALRLEG